jgi:DAK2 domain fusion protein YloV
MGVVAEVTAAGLREAMCRYRDALRAHQQVINRLNVFPVPDGDTGTNMMLTAEAVVAELDVLEGSSMAEVCRAVAHGSLMGARGNSGVILSQLLRGVSSRFASAGEIGPTVVAEALVEAAELGRKAVVRPVEGTILTVAHAAGEGAESASAAGADLCATLEAARGAAGEALAATQGMLPALTKAGVVDAGGAGYVLLLDAFLSALDGRPLPEPPALAAVADGPAAPAGHQAGGDVSRGLRYEVMYFLHAPDETIPYFRDVWAGIGDSIVVVGGEGTWNCHIHTDDVGAAIEAALDCGRPRNIRVTDLAEQIEEERWVREYVVEPAAEEPPGEVPTTDVVAVVTGEGVGRIFRSLGVHHLVPGGQSMNPSTAQILAVVDRIAADQVVILPNNKNIRPVAEQVNGLTDKAVRVVPSGSIVEGFAALLAYDPAAGADVNASAMSASASRVLAGEVTRAVRDATTDAGPVRTGDWIGLCAEGVVSIADSPSGAAAGLLARLVGGHELVTVIEGEEATPNETRRITEWLRDECPELAVEVHHGGQPLYPYLFGVE